VRDEPGGLGEGGAIRVLYVDDDPQAGDLVARQLEQADSRFTVLTASDAADARGQLAETAVDCVLSDYDMPGDDGLDLLETVRAEYGSLPFVLYTARGSEAVASEAIARGVDDYVRKSAGRDTGVLLANRIANAVDGHRARRGYRELFAETADGLALHDPETGAVVRANDRYCEIVGREESAVVGDQPTAFTAATDRPADWLTERIRAVDGEQELTWHVRRPDGTLAITEVRLCGVTVGRRELVLASTREVTDRERTRRQLEAVIEKTDHAVFIKNTDGEYELANEAAAEGIDTTVEEMVGKRDVELVGETEGQRIRERDLEVIDGGEPVRYTRRLQSGEGRQVYRNEKYPLRGPDGEVEGLVGISTDRTRAEQRERTLRELNAVATEMSGYESREAICRRTVEAAEATLSLTNSCVSLAEEAQLVPVAHSPELSADHVVAMGTDEGVLGRSYTDGETVVTTDAAGDTDAATTAFRSAVTVPLGDHGVFQTVAEPPGFFDDQDAESGESRAGGARQTRPRGGVGRAQRTVRGVRLRRQPRPAEPAERRGRSARTRPRHVRAVGDGRGRADRRRPPRARRRRARPHRPTDRRPVGADPRDDRPGRSGAGVARGGRGPGLADGLERRRHAGRDRRRHGPCGRVTAPTAVRESVPQRGRTRRSGRDHRGAAP